MMYHDANTTTLFDAIHTVHSSYNEAHLPTDALR